MTILGKLSQWQKSQAQKEGLEGYMVVSFGTLKLVAAKAPQSIEDLLAVKGMGPRKVEKYGDDILAICSGVVPAVGAGDTLFRTTQIAPETVVESDVTFGVVEDVPAPRDEAHEMIDESTGEIFSQDAQQDMGVGDFLAQLNQILSSYFSQVRVRGEVIGFKCNRNGHAYFEIKDGNGIMRCSVFKQYYDASGVELSDGMEVIITGKPSHHTTYGFSFIGCFVELAGEGALKKAYDDLKKKIQGEGLMDSSRKRVVPEMPVRVGLITSPTGAALGDFTTNVGNYGYTILFHGARVEGAQAAADLLRAMKVLSSMDLDVLVVTRGGGSLESLQAFNNEKVIRAIADFPAPVVAGIGHEQDETISTLVADIGVSTPTAAARVVRESYDHIDARLDQIERVITTSFAQSLQAMIQRREYLQHALERSAHSFIQKPRAMIESFERAVERFSYELLHVRQRLATHEKLMHMYDPRAKLSQGYSIVRDSQGRIIKGVDETAVGEDITIQLKDGKLEAQINKTINT